jgi:hypothetical protein
MIPSPQVPVMLFAIAEFFVHIPAEFMDLLRGGILPDGFPVFVDQSEGDVLLVCFRP